MISFRQRLGRGLISVLCIVFVIHWFAADWVIRSVAEKQMANRLMDDAYSLMETLVSQGDDQVGFNSFHISSVYNRPLSGHYYTVKVDTQIQASPSLQNYALDFLPIGPDQYQLYHLKQGPQQQPLLVFGVGLVKFGHRIVISVAEDLSSVDHDITTIRLGYLALTLVILVCAIVLQRWDVRRALYAFTKVSQELDRVSRGQQQDIATDVPVEIRPLVKEINRLLQLVVRRLQQSRTAIGNLAHAIKPPMAVLFRVAEHPAFDAYPDLRKQLQTQTDSIHRSIERELKRARIAGNQQSVTAFNPHAELTSLSLLLQNIYAEKSLNITWTAPDTSLHFDREDMLEMLGNLLDNACKWAQSEIDVRVEFRNGLSIEVADDGPGCSDTDAKILTQRGLRLDESVQGHGLGLAIVLDIVNCYQGELQITRSSSLGGFLAKISLPPA